MINFSFRDYFSKVGVLVRYPYIAAQYIGTHQGTWWLFLGGVHLAAESIQLIAMVDVMLFASCFVILILPTVFVVFNCCCRSR